MCPALRETLTTSSPISTILPPDNQMWVLHLFHSATRDQQPVSTQYFHRERRWPRHHSLGPTPYLCADRVGEPGSGDALISRHANFNLKDLLSLEDYAKVFSLWAHVMGECRTEHTSLKLRLCRAVRSVPATVMQSRPMADTVCPRANPVLSVKIARSKARETKRGMDRKTVRPILEIQI